jgi:hypothetical protein
MIEKLADGRLVEIRRLQSEMAQRQQVCPALHCVARPLVHRSSQCVELRQWASMAAVEVHYNRYQPGLICPCI